MSGSFLDPEWRERYELEDAILPPRASFPDWPHDPALPSCHYCGETCRKVEVLYSDHVWRTPRCGVTGRKVAEANGLEWRLA